MKKVLLIDDEQDISFVFKRGLEASEKFKVKVCNEGREGIRKAKEFMPDIILLDMMMPELPGDEVAALLKEDPQTASIPIIFLTAMVRMEESHQGAVTPGRTPVVSKGVTTKQLISIIEQLT